MFVKDPSTYDAVDKEDLSLEMSLQLILIESLDPVMHTHVLNCKDAKHIWETIEIINEGTEEVRENRLEILTSEYEHFRSYPGEGITEVFERYNKLINNLNLQGKYYTNKEIIKKFLLTLPVHLEHRITAIREGRDMNKLSLERIYGVLKTYELEQIQQREIYGTGRVVDTLTGIVPSTSTALYGQAPEKTAAKVVQPYSSDRGRVVAEHGKTSASGRGGDFYSMEELEQLEDESMAMVVRKFDNFRFRRDPISDISPLLIDSREEVLHPLVAQGVATILEWWTEARSVVSTVKSSDTLLLNVKCQDKQRKEIFIKHLRRSRIAMLLLLRERVGMIQTVKMKMVEILHW